MSKMTTEEIISAIKELSVVELNELVKKCEEEFNVSASIGNMVAAGSQSGGAVAEDTKDSFNVELVDAGASKVKVIKIVREVTGLSLKEAKDLVDSAPKVIKEQMKKEEANELKSKLEEVGAKVNIK